MSSLACVRALFRSDRHTVIVGKIHMAEICGEAGVEVIPPETVVQWIFQYFLSIGKELVRPVPRRRERALC